MPFSGQLGSDLAILGESLALGFAEVGDPFNQNVSNSLGWAAQEAVYDPVINMFVSQSMFTTSTAEALYRAVSQTIFTASTANPDAYVEVVQYLGFTDRKLHGLGNTFGLQGVVTIAVIENASNFIFTNPSQNNKVVQGHIVSNSLGWTDVVATSSEVNAENTFGFVDAWTFAGSVFDQNVTQDGGGFLRQTVSVTISDNTCRELEYDPIIGSTDDDTYDDFKVTKPIFSTGTVEFTYPLISPTNTLTLDDPDFGNEDTLNFTRIDRETRGGDRKIFSDGKWASWERTRMTVSDLCEVDADDIITFLNASLGKTVRLTDWEGRIWEGVIVEPETDIVKSRGGWRLDLVFEAKVTTAFVEHNELIVTHNVAPGDDIVVTHDL